jgi:hypothetical protein
MVNCGLVVVIWVTAFDARQSWWLKQIEYWVYNGIESGAYPARLSQEICEPGAALKLINSSKSVKAGKREKINNLSVAERLKNESYDPPFSFPTGNESKRLLLLSK